MPRAISVNAPVPHVVKADAGLPSADRTEFLIRPMNLHEWLRFEELSREADKSPASGAALWDFVLSTGLVGWRRFRDAHGNEVPFVRAADVAPSDQPFLAHIDLETAHDLFRAVLALSQPSKADSGNSSTPSG